MSVDSDDHQHYLDVHVAYRRACENAIEYLSRFGYSAEQAYVLLGAAPIEGRVNCLLEHPNVCVSIGVPKSIFDFDISLGSKNEIVERALGDLAQPSTSPQS